ncbi:MFS transporter [Pseudomonas xanthosomatis]|uniref:MFS transporter n=1 Tax=Pseudomonas xanthosomatis TaxID=2842356 RepID=UPI003518335F
MANARRNIVLLLLMFVIMLSIMDKTIFAFAGPQIIDELDLSPSTFGLIGSAFYCLYSISGVLVGFLANRVPSRWILLGMALVWMASQTVTGLSQTLVGLILGRLLLGAGTGPATAITQHACFKWFDARNRVVPSTLVQVSIMLGALLGGISLPLAVDHIGWRGAYLVLGALSVVWMIAWLLFGAEGQQGTPAATEHQQETRYRSLLLGRTYVWITVVGFIGYLPNALAYSWIPVYMQKGHGLTPLQNGYLALGATTFVLLVNVAASALALGRPPRSLAPDHSNPSADDCRTTGRWRLPVAGFRARRSHPYHRDLLRGMRADQRGPDLHQRRSRAHCATAEAWCDAGYPYRPGHQRRHSGSLDRRAVGRRTGR